MRLQAWMAAGLLAVAILGCSREPRRPAAVPADAIWVGTRKEGVFVQVGERLALGWRLKIYDRQGVLRREGPYRLRGVARAEILAADLVSYDGEALHLSEDGLLVPMP